MTKLAPASAFSLLFLAVALPAQEHDLRVQTKQGTTVWLSRTEKMEQLIDMGGQEMESTSEKTTVLQCHVKEVDDKGNAVVEVKVARVHGSMTMPMLGDVEFDSAQAGEQEDDGGGAFGMPSPSSIAKSQTDLAGKSFVARIGSDGKAAALEGVAELLKKDKRGPQMMPAVSESMLRDLVESAFGAVPPKPVAVGSSWERKVQENSGGPGVSLQLTLAKVEDDAYEVTADGKVEPPKVDPASDDPRAQMMENLEIESSKVTGSERVSRQDGFVIESRHTTDMDASMETPMPMSMKIKSETRMTRTTEDAAKAPKAKEADAPAKSAEPK